MKSGHLPANSMKRKAEEPVIPVEGKRKPLAELNGQNFEIPEPNKKQEDGVCESVPVKPASRSSLLSRLPDNPLFKPTFLTKEVYLHIYDESEFLGEGSQSMVYLGTRLADQLPVVIKVLETRRKHLLYNSEDGKWSGLVEAGILEHLLIRSKQYPRLEGMFPSLVATHIMDNGNQLIVTKAEGLHSVDLEVFVRCGFAGVGGGLSESAARFFFIQLLDILEAVMMHGGIFHGDFKTPNIIVDLHTMKLKLIDFGVADVYCPGMRYTQVRGTSIFCPSECFTGDAGFSAMGHTVFGLGAVLFSMVSSGGQPPFRSRKEVIAGEYRLEQKVASRLSPECMKVIHDCLSHAEEQRPSLADLRNSPWLKDDLKVAEKNEIDEELNKIASRFI